MTTSPVKVVTECHHMITRGVGGTSSCVDCGVLVYQVFDRPCGECKHHSRATGRSLCRRHWMMVTPDMHVTYSTLPGKSPLCFEAANLALPDADAP